MMEYQLNTGVWEITMACNMRCGHCGSICADRLPNELTPDEALQLCDNLAELGLKKITLSGGEPFLRPDWHELTKRLSGHGVTVNVISNGWLIDEQLLDLAMQSGLTNIVMSLDGLEPTHDSIRKPGSFRRVTNALSLMKQRHFPSAIVTTIMKRNLSELPAMQTLLEDYGVQCWQMQVGLLKPLWSSQNRQVQMPFETMHSTEFEATPEPDIDVVQWPLMKLWITWRQALQQSFRFHLSNALSSVQPPRFNAWRQRRIASVKSELGFFSDYLDHPLFAFELSRGCSINCWFCAFSAPTLSAIFEYTPENRALWREVIQVGVELFGAAAGGALCYYATEPHDNPDYLNFLKDYREISGAALCTATAAPLKDPEWIRSLIAFYREIPLPWPRLSVLSTSMLRQIHDIYTPDELRDVGCLMQMKDAPNLKAASGRLLHVSQRKLGGLRIPADTPLIPQGSISCISGFLINMVDRTIRLISPCYASDRWPHGYRVFAEETFRDAADYRAALEHILAEHLTRDITAGMRLAFRDDLQYTPTDDGFTLLSPNKKHTLRGKVLFNQLGDLVAQGNKTYREIINHFTAQGISVFEISRQITRLFNQGLLDETRNAFL